MQIPVQTPTTTKKTVTVSDRLFTTETSPELLAQAVRTAQANARLSPAHTKSRGEVRGGGRKPWRQKGTGRARVGSSRNPLWRHGGVAFGPTSEVNHSLKMPARMRRQAFLAALSARWTDGAVRVVSDVSLPRPSTKGLLAALADVGVTPSRTLFVIASPDEAILRSSDNLADLTTVSADHLTTVAILSAGEVVFTESGLKAANDRYATEPANKRGGE